MEKALEIDMKRRGLALPKKTTEFPVKIRKTRFNSIEIKIYIPANYLKKVLGIKE